MLDRDSLLGGPRYARLTPAQCAQLHHASLTILECTGVCLFEPAAIELLKKAGAADKVEALLATHQPEPLSTAAATAVHAIVERSAQHAA